MIYTKPLPKHTPLDYWECYAKIVLEQTVSKAFENLVVMDKPDLQSPDGSIGIEVTRAIDTDQLKAESLYADIEYDPTCDNEWAKSEIVKCGCEYKNGILRGKKESDSFEIILKALRRKLETINKGGYSKFVVYDLFLFSDIYSSEKMRQEALNSMIEISNEFEISFDQIIVLVPGSLYIFEIEERECQVLGISSEKQCEMACLARKIVEDNKQ